MRKSERNLMVLENFILHITHSSEQDNDTTPITFTPNELYQMAVEYIEEDHVDGKEAEDDYDDEIKAERPDLNIGDLVTADGLTYLIGYYNVGDEVLESLQNPEQLPVGSFAHAVEFNAIKLK